MENHLRPQWIKGRTSRQAHADLPPGTVEEEHGREGFSGPASHLYRLRPPTAWESIDGELLPHALDTRRVTRDEQDDLFVVLLENTDVRIGWWTRDTGTPEWFLRNADGDLLYLVHDGEGTLGTEYGPLPYSVSDYLLVPRGTTHQFTARTPTSLLVIEAVEGRFDLPDRGLLGRHALFDPAILEVPQPDPQDASGEFAVKVKREGRLTVVVYPHHPFDVAGWKGDVSPLRLNIADFRPVSSARYHLPPSAHTTFVGSGFVVATFAPRPLEEDPDVLRVPFYHRNIDYDEVIFYHRGEFFSRADITEGMFTFHPSGIHHGPQPQAIERSDASGPGGVTDEIAVNIDTRRFLRLTTAGSTARVPGYENSWHPGDPRSDR